MIHQYVSNGYNIVLDVNSGCVHVVDEITYRVIPFVEKALAQKAEGIESVMAHVAAGLADNGEEPVEETALREVIEEILELKEAGMLYTGDVYEQYIGEFRNRETVVKALCLHIAHDCNLACRYCFAEEGEYHGRKALMSFEVGKKALDFLVAASGSRINLEVDFFGGEPLLNWQVVKDLVAYGRSLEEPHHKKFRFTLTTNGVLLNDEILDFVNREMANIVLSIDGRKEIHDLMRPHRGGQGSYDEVVPEYKKVAESRKQMNYYVRGTFTRHNLDFAEDVMHLADEGFEQISVEPVVAADTEEYALREEDVPTILAEYDKLAREYIRRKKEGKGFNFFHFMIDLEEFLMGNVEEGIVRTDIRDTFKACNVYAREKCKDCFAKFYCSGGCAANAYNFSGSINGAYDLGCELQRKRVECAIMIKAALADEEKEKVL